MTGQTIPVLLTLIAFLAARSWAAPLEDAKLLRQVVNQYNPPLVISFLHSRMNFNQQMIKQIESSLTSLDESKRDLLKLALKTLERHDNQLITLEKSGYFANNGTEKVKNFIEQYIMMEQLYPFECDSSGEVNVKLTVDGIMGQLQTLTYDKLTNQIITLIENYLADVEGKESSDRSNHLQKLTASSARLQLQSLIGNLRVIRDHNLDDIKMGDVNHLQRKELDKILTRIQTTIDLFYSQFNRLAGQQQLSTTIKPKSYQQSFTKSKNHAKYVYNLNFKFGASSGAPEKQLLYNCHY